ncbi:hypothetical protein H2201_001436 [Coniosporium apollinis]|uniref:YDG domain-containing protein n=1 Tax=Coniosporium apollinis TaxID=61459 RepID=A0ABQ9P2X6_9PEZI|nr:hypothetical protein H2201_001436 [Coniosporium apollinis]
MVNQFSLANPEYKKAYDEAVAKCKELSAKERAEKAAAEKAQALGPAKTMPPPEPVSRPERETSPPDSVLGDDVPSPVVARTLLKRKEVPTEDFTSPTPSSSVASPEPSSPPATTVLGLPKIRKRSKTTQDPSATSASPEPAAPSYAGWQIERDPPAWYNSFTRSQLSSPTIDRDILVKLQRLKDLIRDFKELKGNENALLIQIRQELHEAEVRYKVTDLLVRKARLLFPDDGLPVLFFSEFVTLVPWDIRADAEELYNKWALRDFDNDVMRGIDMTHPKAKSGQRNADCIKKDYPRIRANFYGNGHLINGQWWPTQLCTVRDGAHGAAQGGIYGTEGSGAFSVVLSGGNHYSDRDEGDEVWYAGTDGADGKATANTSYMLASVGPRGTKEPVRVLRSHNLPQSNRFRPKRGFRYDGLYDVVDSQCTDAEKQIHRFHLVRRQGQAPIRYQGIEARPTPEEIEAYDKIRSALTGLGF